MTTAISIQNVSKAYRLGVIGHGTLREDLQSWWARVRGKEDPNRIIGSKEAIEGDTLWALRDVSFDVEQGSVWGIIGANGAVKSTLLKILSRVTAPTSGQIKIRGRVARGGAGVPLWEESDLVAVFSWGLDGCGVPA